MSANRKMSVNRKNERGFLMAVVLFALVALSIAGATSVLLSSSDLNIIGSERRRHQVEACADAGVDAAIGTLPDIGWSSSVTARPSNPNTTPGTYNPGLYYTGNGMVARAEHYSVNDGAKTYTTGTPTFKLPAEASSAFAGAGSNWTNFATKGGAGAGGAAGLMGSGLYRMVSTCKTPNSPAASEVESVVVYGIGH